MVQVWLLYGVKTFNYIPFRYKKRPFGADPLTLYIRGVIILTRIDRPFDDNIQSMLCIFGEKVEKIKISQNLVRFWLSETLYIIEDINIVLTYHRSIRRIKA